jgi:hypothetical protein
VVVEVHGAGGLIDADIFFASVDTFWGASSDGDPITHIISYAENDGGDIVDYIYFGDAGTTAAQQSDWGMVKALY